MLVRESLLSFRRTSFCFLAFLLFSCRASLHDVKTRLQKDARDQAATQKFHLLFQDVLIRQPGELVLMTPYGILRAQIPPSTATKKGEKQVKQRKANPLAESRIYSQETVHYGGIQWEQSNLPFSQYDFSLLWNEIPAHPNMKVQAYFCLRKAIPVNFQSFRPYSKAAHGSVRGCHRVPSPEEASRKAGEAFTMIFHGTTLDGPSGQ